eukprot:GFUD01055985.1.p1 GENE.GFUD01055985.1~~GFUD01055985.1.p1  ORF type:complete len:219 (+),score=63.25 GFUD01055985.1:129-785(+)
MNDGTEEGGGRLEFGFGGKKFPTKVSDYFSLLEEKCSVTHSCSGRVKGVRQELLEAVITPASGVERDIADLLNKCGDGHISDWGWKENVSIPQFDGAAEGNEKTNLHGFNWLVWFDVQVNGYKGEDEDCGGRVNFGFVDNKFPTTIEDYFLTKCEESSMMDSGGCGVMGVLSGMKSKVLGPPSYDPRDIVELINDYRDAQIIDWGWREVDTEEWTSDI